MRPATSTATTPIGLCQRNETPLVDGWKANSATTPIPHDQAGERAVPVHALEGQRENEDAEQGSVEEGSEAVDDFDQRTKAGGEGRNHAGEQAPERRRVARDPQVVRVGLGPASGAAGRCR